MEYGQQQQSKLRPASFAASAVPAIFSIWPVAEPTETTKKVSVANLTAGREVAALRANIGEASGQNGVFDAVIGSANATSGDNTGLVIVTNSTGKGWIGFNNANNSSIPGQVTYNFSTNVMGFRSSGNYEFDVGNIKILTAGKGIDFSANTNAAGMTSELLSWYEEGIWTPTLRFGGGSTGITYTTQQGRYTRVGRTVTVRFEINLSNKGSSTGEADVTGLPFAAANLNSMSVYLYANFDATYRVGIAYLNASSINEIAGSGTSFFTNAQFTNTSRFWGTCTYQV